MSEARHMDPFADIPTAAELRDRSRNRIAELEAVNADLLAACEKVELLFKDFGNPFDGNDWQAVQDIRAAIAKAKGTKS